MSVMSLLIESNSLKIELYATKNMSWCCLLFYFQKISMPTAPTYSSFGMTKTMGTCFCDTRQLLFIEKSPSIKTINPFEVLLKKYGQAFPFTVKSIRLPGRIELHHTKRSQKAPVMVLPHALILRSFFWYDTDFVEFYLSAMDWMTEGVAWNQQCCMTSQTGLISWTCPLLFVMTPNLKND